MTTQEFFIETVNDELPRFERALKALPEDKLDYKPDPKSRSALELASLFATESDSFISILETGILDVAEPETVKFDNINQIVTTFKQNMESVRARVSSMTKEDWASDARMMAGEKEEWKTTKANMVWGVLLDMIHHRGQLSTYIRPMGGKVPSIYGPSADSSN